MMLLNRLVASECNSEPVVNNTSSVIRLLTILPYPLHPNDSGSLQPFWDGGLNVLPAAQLAVEHVNEDPNTLPGYRVELINVDGGCNIFSKALINFVQHVRCGPPIAGIIGPGCSDSTLAISSLLGRPEIALPNIHLATSPLLENRTNYPNTYGILSSSFTIIEATFSLIKHNKWEKVAILYDSTIFVHLSQQLRDTISRELQSGKIVFYSLVYDTYLPIDAITRSSARVIITLTSLAHAQKLLCIAHVRGMAFPRYQWVISGFDIREFLATNITFHYSGTFYSCSNNLLILKDNLVVSYTLDSIDAEDHLVSGYTYHNIVQQYLHRVYNYNIASKTLSISPSIWATITYDAVWALVLAINMSTIIVNAVPVNISCLPFGTKMFTNEIKQNLDKIQFAGASGFIDFNTTSGYTHRTVDIVHINNLMDVNLVGFADGESISILTDDLRIFINTTSTSKFQTVHPSAAVIFLLIILSLFLASLTLHIISTVKRKHPSIKASSPLLNHFVFFGCYTWTAAAIIYILFLKTLNYGDSSTYANGCHAVWVWLIPIGMTLTVGTLIAKTWRIYRIFVHFRNPGRLLSNQVLITLVLIQLGFDIAFGTVWSAVSPMQVENIDRESVMEDNLVTHTVERSCVFMTNGISYLSLFWIIILYSYKVLQILSLFTLSLLTRNVTNRKFTTFLLRRTSYLMFVLYVSLLPTFTVLWYKNAEIHTDFVIMCLLISSTVSVCLVFVLLPPAIPILKVCLKYFTSSVGVAKLDSF